MAWTVTDGVYTVSFAELQSLLNALPENSVDNPHRINITNLTNENLDSSQTPNTLGWLLNFTSRKCFDLRETILPSNITRLFKTFYNCRCLIYGFNNYENITDMEMTFYGCNNLREFIGYINPTKLDNCFSGCTSLTKFINLKNKIDTVDITSSFVGCSSLEEINLNIGVATEISSLFSNCTSLKKATLIIDDVIDSYNRYIFNNCSSLEDVTIQLRRDTSFKDIERLFYNCSNLKTINISPNVINAAEETRDVFYGCSSLQEIKLIPPEEIKETNDYKVFLVSFFSNPDFSVKVYDKNGIKHNIAYITWRGLHPIQLSVQGKTDELGFFSEYDLTDEIIQYSLTSNSKITKDITKPNLFGKNMIFKADSPKNFLTNIIFPDGITTDCTSSASSENKEIVLASWTDLGLPNRCNIDVTFTNGNSYGETTIATPTHPKLIVKNATGDTIGTFDICDSRGHFAGKGCWNDGDLICFKRSGNKMLMTNHDVREATSDYKIYSDGLSEYTKDKIDSKLANKETVSTNNDITIINNRVNINSEKIEIDRVTNVCLIHAQIILGAGITTGAFGINFNFFKPESFIECNWYCSGVGSGIGITDYMDNNFNVWLKGGTYNSAQEWNSNDFANKTLYIDAIFTV